MLSAVFTGIVQHLGSVAAISQTAAGRRLTIDLAGWSHAPALGESIAVNGCCLTVADVALGKSLAHFDVIHQTLRLTTIGELSVEHRVNLEHSVTPSTMLGGHIVQGHVDGVGRIVAVNRSEGEIRLRINPPAVESMRLVVDKGSIAVNGVSLTVAGVGPDWFEVALIPTTLALTNLGSLRVGAGVNLEFDYVAKVVANWLDRRSAQK